VCEHFLPPSYAAELLQALWAVSCLFFFNELVKYYYRFADHRAVENARNSFYGLAATQIACHPLRVYAAYPSLDQTLPSCPYNADNGQEIQQHDEDFLQHRVTEIGDCPKHN
jgi:hypothetical protein